MEAAIRFSQNSLPGNPDQYFLKIDVAGRALQLYNIKHQSKSKLDYELIHTSSKLPPFRAFDWHPSDPALVAIGQTGGEASLVNLADSQAKPMVFTVRSPRSCNAVGTNSNNWLAAGLEKVRNDFCLNVWDLNQRLNSSPGKSYGKSGNEPIYKLASGEPITSLRFFQDQPQLLAAGVKGQYIRLYDLREATNTFALQFATRCVNNIAIDFQDENYFASCLPANNPTVSVWDRRMVTRTNAAHIGFGYSISQAEQHPEASLELKDVIDPQGQIWGFRFSKTCKGQFGVLSSTGQLRILGLRSEDDANTAHRESKHNGQSAWDQQPPKGLFLDDSHNLTNAYNEHPLVDETKRVVSFDFTTGKSHNGSAKLITLTGDGEIRIEALRGGAAAFVTRSRSLIIQATKADTDGDRMTPSFGEHLTLPALDLDHDHPAGEATLYPEDDILAQSRKRCEAGYLLDASLNKQIVSEHEMSKTFWTNLEHAKTVSAHDALVQGGVDFSFLGIYGLWMEKIDTRTRWIDDRLSKTDSNLSSLIKDLVRKLNLHKVKDCETDYPEHRALCLYVAGLPATKDEVKRECDVLLENNEHTKAAALSLFAGEERICHQVLRAPGSEQYHKMLAMALAGSKNRHHHFGQGVPAFKKSQGLDGEPEDEQDEEWQEIVSAVAGDLKDSYAKSILAYVKTGDWHDVVSQVDLPLRFRLQVALRHFADAELTQFLSETKQEVIVAGDLAGADVIGLGTSDGVELLRTYAKNTGDLQTAALGMSFAAVFDRYLPRESPRMRLVHCFRESYKAQLMSLGLKFDKARFDVALSKAIREVTTVTQPRKKEQIRLVCSHCNQSLSQFGHEQQSAEQKVHMTDTPKHPLAPEKAAVAGVVCPKCGRHLPRCGVCDLWLGTPDETFSKWYKPPQRSSNSTDLNASMVGSTVTAIGPQSNAPSISVTGSRGQAPGKSTTKKLTTADLIPEAVEIVDEEVARQKKEKQWYDAMHKFTVFCMQCSHAFHAEHAKMWFDGTDGLAGHRHCPVPLCECLCNG